MKQFGESLREARVKANLTQKQVAEKCGSNITPVIVSQYEIGQKGNPTRETINQFVGAIGCQHNDLF